MPNLLGLPRPNFTPLLFRLTLSRRATDPRKWLNQATKPQLAFQNPWRELCRDWWLHL